MVFDKNLTMRHIPLLQPRIQDLAKGGAVLLEGRHIDNECMRSQGRIRKAGGGAVRFRPIQKRGGGGGSRLFYCIESMET